MCASRIGVTKARENVRKYKEDPNPPRIFKISWRRDGQRSNGDVFEIFNQGLTTEIYHLSSFPQPHEIPDQNMTNITELHKKLVAEFEKTPKDPKAVEVHLKQLTDALASNNSTDATLYQVYRDTYEITVLLAVLNADMKTFEKSILQVIVFYDAYPAEHPNKYLMLGLYLMFLLASKDRLSDFHMLLEKIPQKEQLTNAYIATPVKLEQSFMEGSYNKVVITEKTIPSPFYAVFIRIMMDAVRENIAYSVQRSVEMLSVPVATTMLLFENESQALQFANQHNWKVQNGYFVFEKTPIAPEKQPLDTSRIAKQMIYYAKQLEMIV